METGIDDWTDPGIFMLRILFRLRGVDVDPDQIRALAGNRRVDIAAMRRCASELGFKARSSTTRWDKLPSYPLPGIVGLRGGGFLLLGRVGREEAVILAPKATRPSVVARRQFEALWDGRIVIVSERGALANLARQLAMLLVQVAAFSSRRGLELVHQFATKERAKQVVQLSTSMAGTVMIDLAARARKVGRELSRPKGDRYLSDELAFLPAALEIVETPPSPIGRAIAISIAAIFTIALAWACIGKVDIVAVAQGKIIPKGGTKTVQPFETGVVRAIHVHDGQPVKAGDVLVELDATMNTAELSHAQSDLMAAQLDVARLRAALTNKDDPLSAFIPPRGATPELIEMQRQLLVSQTAEEHAKIAAIERQIAEKQAARTTIQASIEKLKATIAPLQQRVDIREQLVRKELGSKITYLSELQELVGQQQEVAVQQSRNHETDAAIAALTETKSKTAAEYERNLLADLAKAEQRVAGLKQDVVKARQRTSLRRLTAPVDGVVQQLSVHTIGGVVTPAQKLMLVVPAGSPLEIEAMVSNRDIGFVAAGQEAAIKVDTFNFTRYGLLHGKILSISQDAIVRDKPETKDGSQGMETGGGESKGQELSYAARISLDRSQIRIEDKRVNLSPGMAVTVEIKTGARRIISYLLSPLARYKHDSLRER